MCVCSLLGDIPVHPIIYLFAIWVYNIYTVAFLYVFFSGTARELHIIILRRNIYVFFSCNIQLYHEYCCCVISSLPIGCMASFSVIRLKIAYGVIHLLLKLYCMIYGFFEHVL